MTPSTVDAQLADKLILLPHLAETLARLVEENRSVWVELNTPENTAISIFKLEGADIAGYLQRRTSNDVLALAVGEGHANTFLDKKAYLQAVFSLHRAEETVFYALMPSVLASAFEQEVLRFKIMEQFTCTNATTQWQVVAHWSGGVSAHQKANSIRGDEQTGAYKITAPFWVFGSQGEALNAKVLLAPLTEPYQPAQGTLSLDFSTFKALQGLWGVPAWGTDLSPTVQLPETGLEHWTVSYTKGCFLGQETVARVRTYGGVQQTLMGVKLNLVTHSAQPLQSMLTENTSQPWQVFLDDKKVALITSGVIDEATQTLYGLAYLNRAFRLPGVQVQPFTLQLGNSQSIPIALEIVLLPFKEGLPSALPVNDDEATRSQASTQSAQRLHEVAMGHFVENRTEAALQVLNQLLASHPNFLEAYETKGVLLSRLARYEEAIETMHQLLEKNDKHVMAYTNLSVFWLKLNDKDQAEHYKAKATSVAMGLKMAEAMAKKAAMQQQESAPIAEVSEADALANHQKKLEEKIALFQHALQFAPTDALAHYGLGTTYLELHQLEAAASAFEQAITFNPKHSQAYLQWAETLFALQHFQATAEVLASGIPVASTRGDLQPLAQMKTLQEKVVPFL